MEDVDPDVGDSVMANTYDKMGNAEFNTTPEEMDRAGAPQEKPKRRRSWKTPQTFVMDCVSLDVAPTVHFTDKGFEVECVDSNNVARICLSFYQAEALRTRLGKALGIGE